MACWGIRASLLHPRERRGGQSRHRELQGDSGCSWVTWELQGGAFLRGLRHRGWGTTLQSKPSYKGAAVWQCICTKHPLETVQQSGERCATWIFSVGHSHACDLTPGPCPAEEQRELMVWVAVACKIRFQVQWSSRDATGAGRMSALLTGTAAARTPLGCTVTSNCCVTLESRFFLSGL